MSNLNTNSLIRLHQDLTNARQALINTAENNNSVIQLTQANFQNGTYIISNPGVYRLTENISFNPNSLAQTQISQPGATSWDSGDPLPSQFTTVGGAYDPKAYGIGFFAAVAITTSDVVLDLNGFAIEQSKEHALQQRFFAIIELADQPFVSAQGPHDFGPKIDSANKTYIMNGKLGRSSHHGIHGNGNKNILLDNLTFVGYEVAACALNGAENVVFNNCVANGSRLDVPVLGTFSAGRFLRPYLNKLETDGYTGEITVQESTKNITQVKSELKTALNNVFSDLITDGNSTIDKTTHLAEWKLFHNSAGIVDGNAYGFLFHALGVAVLGFPLNSIHQSKNIYLKDVVVNKHQAEIREVPALPGGGSLNNNTYGGGIVQNDPVGSVFQIYNRDADGNLITIDGEHTSTNEPAYLGNVVANAQALVAKAILDGFNFGTLSTSRNSINYLTLDWMAGTKTLSDVVPDRIYICNGDSMFHVDKGVIGYKMDAIDNLYMKNCRCLSAVNKGGVGFASCNQDYLNGVGKSHPDAVYPGYGGANVRGLSLASANGVLVEDCYFTGIKAHYGSAYGIDVHLNSDNVTLKNIEFGDISAGCADDLDLSDYQNNPTAKPLACAVHIEKRSENYQLIKPRITGELSSPFEKVPYCLNMNLFQNL